MNTAIESVTSLSFLISIYIRDNVNIKNNNEALRICFDHLNI